MKTTSMGLILPLLLPLLATAAPERLNLAQTVEKAVELAPSLDGFRKDAEVRKLERKSALAGFFPQLDFNAIWGTGETKPDLLTVAPEYDPSTGFSRDTNQAYLQLTETLWDNGSTYLKYKAAKIQQELADLTFANERDKLTLSIVSEYLRYSLAVGLLEIQENQYNLLNKQYQTMSGQYRQGVKTRRDYLRFKSEVRRSELEVMNAKLTLEKSKIELRKLAGFGPETDFIPVGVDLKLDPQIAAQAPDVSKNVLYRMQQLRLDQTETDVALARRAWGPELNLNANAAYGANDYIGTGRPLHDVDYTTWSAQVVLKFNLIDWGTRSRGVAIASLKRDQQNSANLSELQSFTAESAALGEELKKSRQSFLLSKELLELENSSYGFLDGEYRNGRVSYVDLILSLQNFLNAKTGLQSSYFDWLTQIYKYKFYEGSIYEFTVKK